HTNPQPLPIRRERLINRTLLLTSWQRRRDHRPRHLLDPLQRLTVAAQANRNRVIRPPTQPIRHFSSPLNALDSLDALALRNPHASRSRRHSGNLNNLPTSLLAKRTQTSRPRQLVLRAQPDSARRSGNSHNNSASNSRRALNQRRSLV